MDSLENGNRYRITNINGEVLNGVFESNHTFVDASYTVLESRIRKVELIDRPERIDGPVLVGEDELELKHNLKKGKRYAVETNTDEKFDGTYRGQYFMGAVDGIHIHFLLFEDVKVKLKPTGVPIRTVELLDNFTRVSRRPMYGPHKPLPNVIESDSESDVERDARAQRKPTKRKRVKRARKMTKQKK